MYYLSHQQVQMIRTFHPGELLIHITTKLMYVHRDTMFYQHVAVGMIVIAFHQELLSQHQLLQVWPVWFTP